MTFDRFIPQLFWEKKLSGLNTYDIAEELVKTMDLPKGLQGKSGKEALKHHFLLRWRRAGYRSI